jgi:two-component system, sensor histidine kinase and response regulator
VLLAEDNLVNQRVATGLLQNRGHHVTVVGTGREAVAAVEREVFDIVLMDVQMPEMGGLEAAMAIRERERHVGGHVRIVAMTAHAMVGDRERCLAAGMDGYLAKPVDRERLISVVEGQSRGDAATSTVRTSPGAFDKGQALARLGGDEDLLADVVRLFLVDCPKHLVTIKSAVERRDVEGIRAGAHALKGAAGNLSARTLADAAAILERIANEGRLDAAESGWRRVWTEASEFMDALRRSDAATPLEVTHARVDC